jgi:hypothetical protein
MNRFVLSVFSLTPFPSWSLFHICSDKQVEDVLKLSMNLQHDSERLKNFGSELQDVLTKLEAARSRTSQVAGQITVSKSRR